MKNEFFYPSKDGMTQIHAIEWIPEGDVAGVLQICHGMVEYIDRYDEFAAFLASQGFYVVGHDHLGHGQSITSEEKLGYFHHTNGNDVVVSDIHHLRKLTQSKYPALPYFIMGHSMGSFLVRQYLGLYSEGVSGAIIMGTGNQPDAIVQGGMLMCKIIASFKGWEYRSKFVNDMAVGGYEKKMGLSWLSKNPENQEKYLNDPLCGYMFTLNAYYNMFQGMHLMNKHEKEGKALKSLPMFFVSGAEDPVGEFGKGVQKVATGYRNRGYQNVQVKLYQDDTHEILNEFDRETVYNDILNFLKSI
jgi:alpha-beta hydrolase superfamily lysophospholipase